jgi:hypothetical protein
MKVKTLSSALLAIAGMAFVQSAHAANTSPGDLILGVQATGGTGSTTDLEVDLGSVYNFLGAGTVNLYNYVSSAELISLYGSNYATRTDLTFGLVASNDHTNVGGQNTATEKTEGALSSTSVIDDGSVNQGAGPFGTNSGSNINSLYSGINGPDANVTSLGGGVYTDNTSDGLSYTALEALGAGNWKQGDFIVDQTFGSGLANEVYLFGYNGSNTPTAVAAFDFVAAPEPSEYALLGLGVLLLAGFVRRQRRNNLVG